MANKKQLIKDEVIAKDALLNLACTLYNNDDFPEEEVYKIVKKTIDKFQSECYNLYKEER